MPPPWEELKSEQDNLISAFVGAPSPPGKDHRVGPSPWQFGAGCERLGGRYQACTRRGSRRVVWPFV